MKGGLKRQKENKKGKKWKLCFSIPYKWSEWWVPPSRPLVPKTSALLTELHPDKKLVSLKHLTRRVQRDSNPIHQQYQPQLLLWAPITGFNAIIKLLFKLHLTFSCLELVENSEISTSRLQGACSAAELHQHCLTNQLIESNYTS